jgi:hypothetical protein
MASVKSYRRAGFDLDETELKAGLDAFDAKFSKYVTQTFDFAAVKTTEQMKAKAPWTDRTSAARNGLHSKATHRGRAGFKQHELLAAHGVPYGIWLEIANSGKYAILIPTIVAVGREIMKVLNGSFNNLDSKPSVNPKVQMPHVSGRVPAKTSRQRSGATKSVAKRTTPTKGTKRTRRT